MSDIVKAQGEGEPQLEDIQHAVMAFLNAYELKDVPTSSAEKLDACIEKVCSDVAVFLRTLISPEASTCARIDVTKRSPGYKERVAEISKKIKHGGIKTKPDEAVTDITITPLNSIDVIRAGSIATKSFLITFTIHPRYQAGGRPFTSHLVSTINVRVEPEYEGMYIGEGRKVYCGIWEKGPGDFAPVSELPTHYFKGGERPIDKSNKRIERLTDDGYFMRGLHFHRGMLFVESSIRTPRGEESPEKVAEKEVATNEIAIDTANAVRLLEKRVGSVSQPTMRSTAHWKRRG